MHKIITLFLASIYQLQVCASFKILLVFPVPTKSHAILGEAFVKLLLADGHEITYITPFPMANPSSKLRQVNLSTFSRVRKLDHLAIDKLVNKGLDYRNSKWDVHFNITRNTLLHENVRALLDDKGARFDAVVAEWMFSELYAGFAAVYNCPLIWSTSMDPNWLVLRLIDEAPNPAYSPFAVSDDLVARGFGTRVRELWAQWSVTFLRYMYYSLKENELYLQAFNDAVTRQGRTLPPLDTIKYNGSLILGNSHASVGLPMKLPQNYKPIGGYHIDDKHLEAIPEDLKRILDDANNGVIYFSFGSILDTKRMPLLMKGKLLKMFGQLKQTVVWKVDEDAPPNMPGNVYMTKWAPQQSILAHQNTKLFITHGGLLSLLEAAHFAVPLVAVPAFADQFVNVACAVSKGMARRVLLTSHLHVELKEAIVEVLGNASYKESAKAVSLAYRNRGFRPRKELIFWIKHVIRTRGAMHLRSSALLIPWYQKCYLDLMAVVILMICGIVAIFIAVIKVWAKFVGKGKELLARKLKSY